MELFAWHVESKIPVLKLILPRVEYSQITFDKSGRFLLLMMDKTVVKSYLMDPETWLEKGQKMSSVFWTDTA
ncbi:MAG: hypothetical protein KAJ62_09455 [Desulfobacteraceae bacterium]|nr:hypothetical protein [Desulfobacteraceae bacterium]